MPVPLFLDASALIKRYVAEPTGSAAMQAIVGPVEFRDSLYVSEHIEGEIVATLNRKFRNGTLLSRAFREAQHNFYSHYPDIFAVVPCGTVHCQASITILTRYRSQKIGALDALHLAAAQHIQRDVPLPNLTIAVADRPMAFVARRLGFRVFNPEADPLGYLWST